ncbi:hypothetical protein ACA910_009908 [Epithemia clementina (nom. ined.)]
MNRHPCDRVTTGRRTSTATIAGEQQQQHHQVHFNHHPHHPDLEENHDNENDDNNNDISQLAELRPKIRGYVDGLIRSGGVASPQESAAYLRAMELDSDLVQTETDPLQFVRYCHYNLWDGAKRLCVYWTERRALFGDDRAFLPLTLTGTGALTDEDLLTLHAGFPALLPGHCHRPPCLLLDRRKWIPNESSSTDNKLRCLFYLMNILAQDDRAQIGDGILLLAVVMTPRFSPMNFPWMHRATFFGKHAFPVRTQMHLLNLIPRQTKPSFVLQSVQVVAQLIRQYAKPDYPIHVHSSQALPREALLKRARQQQQQGDKNNSNKKNGNSGGGDQPEPCSLEEDFPLVQDLMALGLTKKEIPLCYGGEWKFEEFFDWCRERKAFEEEFYKDRLLKTNRTTTTKGAAAATTTTTFSTTTGPSNRWAQTTASSHHPSSFASSPHAAHPFPPADAAAAAEADKKRKRRLADLVHSRKKRERKQKEIQRIKMESVQLRLEHDALQKLHAQLEVWWQQAQALVTTLESE